MAITRIFTGLSEAARPLLADADTTAAADDANWTVTLPTEFQGSAAVPCVLAVFSYGAGAEGARTLTYYPVVDTGSALVGVEVVSYVEATGVLTLTNRTGGAMPATVYVVIQMIDDIA